MFCLTDQLFVRLLLERLKLLRCAVTSSGANAKATEMFEGLCWLFVFVVAAFYFRPKDYTMSDGGGREWYIVVRCSSLDDYKGEQVDAFYVVQSCYAFNQVASGPMKPGQTLRGYWARNDREREQAAELFERRRKEERDFKLLMMHIEDAWLNASRSRVFRDS